jgi:hypothetical protein
MACGNEVVVKNDIGGFDEAQGALTVSSSGSPGPAPTRYYMAGDGARGFPARPRQLARGAEGGVADLAVGQLMEEQLALFAAGMRGEHFAAQFAQVVRARAPGPGSCSSISRRSRCATAGLSPAVEMAICRRAAAHHRAEEEIAVGNVVHAVAEDVALDASR